jgi:hypothetical protein
MISIKGKFYDGRTSDEVPAVCFIDANGAVTVENSVNGRRCLSLARSTSKVWHYFFPGLTPKGCAVEPSKDDTGYQHGCRGSRKTKGGSPL